MMDDMTGLPSKPLKKHKRGRRGSRKASDPMASLKAAHAALDRGDEAEAKRLALAAVHALHKRTHGGENNTAPKPFSPPPGEPRVVSIPHKPTGNSSRLIAALRHK